MSLGFRVGAGDGSGRELPAHASQNTVTLSYFAVTGMRLVEGRWFEAGDLSWRDRPRAERPIVVNRSFARAYLRDRVLGPFPNGGEVVGVVEDVRDPGATADVDPQIFVLSDAERQGVSLVRPSLILIRTSGDSEDLLPQAHAVVQSVDTRLALAEADTLDSRLSAMLARPRLNAVLVSGFALLSLLIVSAGLFGVLSHNVSRRTREIGLRHALGATPGALAATVIGHALALSATGVAIGLAAAAISARYLSSLLHGVSPFDPLVFAAVPVVVLVVSVLACAVPARRATRIDPLTALRST